MICRVLVRLAALPLLAVATSASAADLTVAVTNVRSARGVVHVDLCRQEEFLKQCKLLVEAPAVTGTTIVKIANVPPGDFAVQATHDENNNKRVDTGLFGVPKEGVGFSNDAPINFGPPKWRKAVFTVAGDMTITLKMRYFTGPRGPQR